MASTYSSLKIQLMGTGENSGTWGTITNTNLGTAIEEAIVGSADVTFASGNVTLTLTDANSSQTARNLRLNLTGTTGGARDLIVPAIEKVYIVNNGCADTVTIKNASGTGISVPPGKTEFVYNNGTNVLEAINHLTSLTLDTPLPVTSGGTGSNTGINASTSVTGILPVANGGTGSNSATFSGANITSLNASAISSGTVPTARLGSGTANNTTFLRGDSTFATVTQTRISGGSTGLTPNTLTGGDVTLAGTLAVASGGTGTATPSLVGGTNITISGSWPNQTVTAAGGGVTSLNGQTGAITNTDLYAIGSYVIGRPQNTTAYATNATVAGTILYATQPLAFVSRSSKGVFNWNFSDSGLNFGTPIRNLVNTGTWRTLGGAQFLSAGPTNNGTCGLWVRIS